MNYNNVNCKIFDKPSVDNFDIISQILPPLSLKFPNNSYDEEKDDKDSNNVIEIRNGKYIRGLMDKGVLGGASKGLIQRIFNDFGFQSALKFIDNIQNILTDYMKTSSYSVWY